MQIDPVFRHPGVLLTAAALVGALGSSVFSLASERQHIRALEAERTQALTELAQTRNQMRDIAARLDSLAAANATRRTAPPAVKTVRASRTPAAPSRPDPRFQELQSEISRQQRELAQTREEIARSQQALQGELHTAREDLQGRLNSTKVELNGSIARNHDELVILQKRGERNFYEFELTKSKDVRRVGPLSLALRKSDTKRKNYNIDMMVEDNRMEKKNINLYEPVWINLSDRPQPVEIVVNFIGKDYVRGYVSESKYKRSELAQDTPSAGAKPAQLTTR